VVVTPIRPTVEFYPAEDYHQDYYKKNPTHYKMYRNGSGRDQFIQKIWAAKKYSLKNYQKLSDDELKKEVDGSYSVIMLKQSTALTVKYFAYADEMAIVTFNNPGGIGQTETLIQDFQLQESPLSTISGTVSDSVNSIALSARIKVYVTSDKPGIPEGAIADTVADISGNFNVTVPSAENYRVEVYPESPFAGKKYEIENLSMSGIIISAMVNPAKIMLVDDDEGENFEEFYFADFQAMGVTYHHWNINLDGVPTAADRNAFSEKIMFWYTGNSSSMPLTQTEQNEIIDHLNTGGKLFLTGQDIAEMHSGSPLTNTLGIDFTQNISLSLIIGVTGDVIGNALVVNVSGYGGANNQTSSDVIQVTDTSTTTKIFHYGGGTSNPAGARYESSINGSRAVFLGFGAESINDPSRRQTLLSRVIDFINTPFTGISDEQDNSLIPNKFKLFQNYPNPFNPNTAIKYHVAKKSHVLIAIYNSLGQKVTTLIDKQHTAGSYNVSWNGTDDFGNRVSSGIYYYQMMNNKGFNQTEKLLFLK